MKFTPILLLVGAMVAIAGALPMDQAEQLERELWVPAGEVTEEHLERFKRASCDLFSFESKWFTPNDSVCAGHCLVKGYKGGRCINKICHCRDKF